MSLRGFFLGTSFAALAVTRLAAADASDDPALAGSIEANLDGKRVVLSTVTSDYEIDLSGDIANVKIKQRFENPYKKAAEGTLPLPDQSPRRRARDDDARG